ncbi:MAG: O-antigen ligase family protein [Anaerolineales bacterium]|nr:O-antigen ligase family protein [Anaerolineales bacterium]
MNSTESYVRPAPRAKLGQRGVATDHAALALAISSTAIFVLSALLAFLIAHDQLVARSKLTLMMVGLLLPLAFAVFARDRWETALATVAVACGFGAGMIGFTDIILRIGGDTGSAAGSLVELLPLAGIGLIWAWARRAWALFAALIACALLGLVALFMSGENSAWIGFVGGVLLGMVLYWHFTVERYRNVLYLIEAILVGLFILALVAYLLLLLAPESAYARVVSNLPPFYQNRLILWRSALPGIQDYVYTGSGLGNAAMVLSSYVYLLHVPYVFHVHNLYLEIFLEQGVAGLVGFLGMLVASLWSVVITLRQGNPRYQRYAVCIGISLFSLAIAGLF